MIVDAFLCDAATVRDGLLYVLGAGIARTVRPTYPSALNLDLAMMVTMQPAEAMEKHRLKVILQGQDGQPVAQVDGEFQLAPIAPAVVPGHPPLPRQQISMPLVLNMRMVGIPAPGVYSFELLMDSHQVRSLVIEALLDPSLANPTPGG